MRSPGAAESEASTASQPAEVVEDREPVGALDRHRLSGDTLHIAGWVVDPDDSDPLAVMLTVDGVAAIGAVADDVRADVARAFPDTGEEHGFELKHRLQPGDFTVCVMATGPDAEEAHKIDCREASVAAPTTTTTVPPTTVPPATMAPTTTVAPTTAPPAPAAPAVAPPVTDAPPATAAPETAPPTSAPPVTEEPAPEEAPAPEGETPATTVAPTTAPPTTAPPTTEAAPAAGIEVPHALRAISACESGTGSVGSHNYTAHNPRSTASGAYQFLDSTWNYNATGGAYVALWQAKGWEHLRVEAAASGSADNARPEVQDAAAVVHFELNGTTPWNPSRHCWSKMI